MVVVGCLGRRTIASCVCPGACWGLSRPVSTDVAMPCSVCATDVRPVAPILLSWPSFGVVVVGDGCRRRGLREWWQWCYMCRRCPRVVHRVQSGVNELSWWCLVVVPGVMPGLPESAPVPGAERQYHVPTPYGVAPPRIQSMAGRPVCQSSC